MAGDHEPSTTIAITKDPLLPLLRLEAIFLEGTTTIHGNVSLLNTEQIQMVEIQVFS